ncbi:hypothetical protein FOZ60_005901 [Perkinsus olseni]|uniref:Uncharacterized protein n=1 Tax=Perkinsus olseni TaxID=32597 RepID=A0A7J6NR04_PEROL|nr:hypothetical protein FOZ60_005901 [Perkinsus olseni]
MSFNPPLNRSSRQQHRAASKAAAKSTAPPPAPAAAAAAAAASSARASWNEMIDDPGDQLDAAPQTPLDSAETNTSIIKGILAQDNEYLNMAKAEAILEPLKDQLLEKRSQLDRPSYRNALMTTTPSPCSPPPSTKTIVVRPSLPDDPARKKTVMTNLQRALGNAIKDKALLVDTVVARRNDVAIRVPENSTTGITPDKLLQEVPAYMPSAAIESWKIIRSNTKAITLRLPACDRDRVMRDGFILRFLPQPSLRRERKACLTCGGPHEMRDCPNKERPLDQERCSPCNGLGHNFHEGPPCKVKLSLMGEKYLRTERLAVSNCKLLRKRVHIKKSHGQWNLQGYWAAKIGFRRRVLQKTELAFGTFFRSASELSDDNYRYDNHATFSGYPANLYYKSYSRVEPAGIGRLDGLKADFCNKRRLHRKGLCCAEVFKGKKNTYYRAIRKAKLKMFEEDLEAITTMIITVYDGHALDSDDWMELEGIYLHSSSAIISLRQSEALTRSSSGGAELSPTGASDGAPRGPPPGGPMMGAAPIMRREIRIWPGNNNMAIENEKVSTLTDVKNVSDGVAVELANLGNVTDDSSVTRSKEDNSGGQAVHEKATTAPKRRETMRARGRFKACPDRPDLHLQEVSARREYLGCIKRRKREVARKVIEDMDETQRSLNTSLAVLRTVSKIRANRLAPPLQEIGLNPEDVKALVKALPRGKASGDDEVAYEHYRSAVEVSTFLAELSIILRAALSLGVFLECWKAGLIGLGGLAYWWP